MTKHNLVAYLFVKQERKRKMSAIAKLDLLEGYGIKGDVSSNYSSPRQVLVVNKADIDQYSIAPGELRENIVLELTDTADLKSGAKLTFSNGAAIRLTFYCEPCNRIKHLVDSPKNLEKKRGILGVIIQSGAVVVNDQVKIEPNYFSALSEIPYERFLTLLQKIPRGKVVTYKQIINSIGVDRSYYRVLPTYLKKTSDRYPKHRVLNSKGQIVSHLHQQAKQLTAEGIKILSVNGNDLEVLPEYIWQNPQIL